MWHSRESRVADRAMNHAYFNRILHLLQQRPQQGKRLIGLEAAAFWELWQRVE
ncbi:MAG TPA: hypothetical protein V6D09_11385 [Leptolyngbyaceae cyanobacterium]